MRILTIIGFGILIASTVSSQEFDDRFVPISELPDELAASLAKRDVEEYTIEGALLRSQVEANNFIVKGWDAQERKTTINPDRVRNQDNLEAYAQSIVLQDQNIEELSFSESYIRIRYGNAGKLLGFIPVHIISRIEISVPPVSEANVSGQIKAHFPWYHFFVAKPFSESDIVTAFAAQANIVNSQHQAQRVAQYVQIIGAVLAGI